tara:strand:+ start:45910 stop:46848 length:939 start_codon:yes stop_codon:yes gene_type:complete
MSVESFHILVKSNQFERNFIMNLQRISDLPPLPQRPVDSHKGTFGKVLVIAGSAGMSGAASLSGMGALRGGAGLVFLAIPQEIQSIVAAVNPCYLTLPLHVEPSGQLTGPSAKMLLGQIDDFAAIAIGPGLGKAPWVQMLIWKLYAELKQPLIIDADALNVIAASDQHLPAAAGPRLFTPHPGEFARLTGKSISEISEDRETHACEYAQQQQVVLLLKGADTVITDGSRIAVNTTGNSGMSTGGTGDVLTGLLTALCGQGMPAFAAAQLAAHLHGLAGDLAAEDLSQPALIASDLIDYLPDAWLQLQNETDN